MLKQPKFFILGMIVVTLTVLPTLNAAGADTQQGKIPISTSSEKAKNYYLQGRDFSEKLRIKDSETYFEKAVQEDPNFAIAYLNLAIARPSAKEFFGELKKAVALSNKASEGERLWILGVEAGANGSPAKQGEYYQKLVASFRNDERAHNLLGAYYLGLQQYQKAVDEFQKAVDINANFTPAYNLLGYSYRFLAKYDESEKAFKKYIDLIPDDPNPLDSYAELLLKIGRYDESIENYRKALSKDPHFFNSYLGIATNYNLKGEHQRAREELQKLYNTARDDGERRAALFGMTVSYVDAGDWQKAIAEQEKMLALAQKINDSANMAGDLNTIGIILVENGNPKEAKAKFDQAAKIMAGSNLSPDVKAAARRNSIFNAALVALGEKDFQSAQAKAKEYRTAAEGARNQFEVWQAHELAGRIALQQKDYDQAISELEQSNLQDPYNIYRLAIAYQGKGDSSKNKELSDRAEKFNALNSLPYAFLRAKSKQTG